MLCNGYAINSVITYPLFLKCSIILHTESIGTEKLNPSAAITFIMFTPTTSPSMLTRGPPEFPYAIGDKNIQADRTVMHAPPHATIVECAGGEKKEEDIPH